jgi:RHS repeat-associated protein
MADYVFDDNGNLTMLDNQKIGSTVRSYGYTYDENGMRTSMTDNDGVHNYVYDTLYQIIQATHPSVPNPLEQFTYDAAGNRLADLTHTNYQYNELNQLIEDDSCMYNYDADGNMTTKISKNTGDTTRFEWDIENKLVEVRKPGMIAKYTYDALGRRMSKTVNGETKKFGYDGNDLILEMNSQDSIIADYTHGPGIDNPLTMNRAGKNYYYAKDGLGSVTALTDSIGSVVHEYKYSVFGKIVEETGDSIENPFAYTSRELDKETGLIYCRARTYNTDIGRFLSQDPIGFSGLDYNLYRYVWNSPENWTDPFGLFKIQIVERGTRSGTPFGATATITGDNGQTVTVPASTWSNPESFYNDPSRIPQSIQEGTYNAVYSPTGHHKEEPGVRIEDGGKVPTLGPNPEHGGASYAVGVNIHEAYSTTNRGSRGCPTIHPDYAPSVWGVLQPGERGTVTIKREVPCQ